MRKYQSHKIVEAAPIIAAEFKEDGSGKIYTANPGQPNSRTLWIVPPGFKRPNTDPNMDPDGGDYFVSYDDGRHLSWSPKAVFEAGYTLVQEAALGTGNPVAVPVLDDAGFEHTARTSLAWRETAMQHLRNEQYYCGIIDSIGDLLGEEVRTQDDGNVVPEVLRAKVYDVARKRLAQLVVDPVPTPRLDRVALAKSVAAIVMQQEWAREGVAGEIPDSLKAQRAGMIVYAVQQALAATTPLAPAPATPVAETYEVYVGSSYYPSGGHLDYKGDADSFDEACEMARRLAQDETLPWWHVVHVPSSLIIRANRGANGRIDESKRHIAYAEEVTPE